MTTALETCPRCRVRWPPPTAPREKLVCPGCGTPSEVIRCSAVLRPRPMPAPAEMGDGAVCWRHGTRSAVMVCSMCGRFACELCAVDASDPPLCADCFAHEVRTGGRDLRFTSHLVQYDNLCLWMVLLPLLGVVTSGFTLFTAPLALILILFRWRQPMSVLPRNGVRRWFAVLLAGLVTLGWAVLAVWVIVRIATNLAPAQWGAS